MLHVYIPGRKTTIISTVASTPISISMSPCSVPTPLSHQGCLSLTIIIILHSMHLRCVQSGWWFHYIELISRYHAKCYYAAFILSDLIFIIICPGNKCLPKSSSYPSKWLNLGFTASGCRNIIVKLATSVRGSPFLSCFQSTIAFTLCWQYNSIDNSTYFTGYLPKWRKH